MKPFPTLMLCGQAGVGKDEVASIITKKFNAIAIAQADPIKRALMGLFDFKNLDLWGPSERRVKAKATYVKMNETDVLARINKFLDTDDISAMDFKTVLAQKNYVYLKDWYNDLPNSLPELNARTLLQSLGTDFYRERVNPDIWADLAMIKARTLLEGNHDYDPIRGLYPFDGYSTDLVVTKDGRFKNELLCNKDYFGINWMIVRNTNSTDNHKSETEILKVPKTFIDRTIINNGTLEQLEAQVEAGIIEDFYA
jgi:hypothetical protein